MQTITVSEGQCLIDIAVQYLGDATRAFEIGDMNAMNLTDEPAIGLKLQVPDADVSKKSIVNTFFVRGLIPASIADTTTHEEGIEIWAVQDDFIVE